MLPLASVPGSNRSPGVSCYIMWCSGIYQKISCASLDLTRWCILWVNTGANQKTYLPRVILCGRGGIVPPCDPTGQWRAQRSNGHHAIKSCRWPVVPHLWKYPAKACSAVLQTPLLQTLPWEPVEWRRILRMPALLSAIISGGAHSQHHAWEDLRGLSGALQKQPSCMQGAWRDLDAFLFGGSGTHLLQMQVVSQPPGSQVISLKWSFTRL